MPWQRRQVDRVGLVRGIERLRPVDDERLGVRSFGARDERDAVLPGDRQARIAERLDPENKVVSDKWLPIVPFDVRAELPGDRHASVRCNLPVSIADRGHFLRDPRKEVAPRVECRKAGVEDPGVFHGEEARPREQNQALGRFPDGANRDRLQRAGRLSRRDG